MRVFFSAGEASGDAYATALSKQLRHLDPEVELEGIGGATLKEFGATLYADSSHWGAISISQSVKIGFRVLFGMRQAAKEFKRGKPGVFVPIDFGFANIRMSRLAKASGWKVIYFVPPRSWGKTHQGKDLPFVTDEIVTPFSWSAEILNKMGAKAHWFGHPMLDLAVGPARSAARKGIAVLPGSRLHEIRENLPVIARSLSAEPVEFAVAPNWSVQQLQDLWAKFAPERREDVFTEHDVFGVLDRAVVAIVCSGTATLQAAIMDCPQIVIYRVSKIVELEGRLTGIMKKIKFFSLPNIFLDREVVPELIQHGATPQAISKHIAGLEADSTAQLAGYAEIRAMLGKPGAITKTAERIIELGRS
ncbi:MAG: hypothetical protein ABL949_03705 [Fimbriimonadaceae bacterium]